MASESSQNPDIIKLRRFLYLGDEFHEFPKCVTYPFSPEKEQLLKELIASGLGSEVAKEVLLVYKNNHYLGLDPLIYTLAVLNHTKHHFYEETAQVCESASSVLTFTSIYKDVVKPSKGWGRGHRTFLTKWYNGKEAKELAVEVTKVKTCHKWTHKDVLCMAHIKAKNSDNAVILKYLAKGLQTAVKDHGSDPNVEPLLNYLKAVHEVNHSETAEDAARLIEIHDLCLEHVATKLVTKKEVALCLINRVPLPTLLLHLLPRFNRAGLLKGNNSHYKAVIERLQSQEALANDSLGPLETFLAIRKWQISNKITPLGKLRQNQGIDDALQNLHTASFKNVKPTETRYLVALDINSTMNNSKCAGCSSVTPSHVSDIALMALVKASNVTTVAFSGEEMAPVEISNEMKLGDIVEKLHEIPAGPVILSAPINWALTKKMHFDTFLVFTDRLSTSQDNDLVNVLKEYKETVHLPNTRYVISTLCDHASTFKHEMPSLLNIVGFNPKLLNIIQDFSCGVF